MTSFQFQPDHPLQRSAPINTRRGRQRPSSTVAETRAGSFALPATSRPSTSFLSSSMTNGIRGRAMGTPDMKASSANTTPRIARSQSLSARFRSAQPDNSKTSSNRAGANSSWASRPPTRKPAYAKHLDAPSRNQRHRDKSDKTSPIRRTISNSSNSEDGPTGTATLVDISRQNKEAPRPQARGKPLQVRIGYSR